MMVTTLWAFAIVFPCGLHAATILRGGSANVAVQLDKSSAESATSLNSMMRLAETVRKFQQDPQVQSAESAGFEKWFGRILSMLVFGVLYYFVIYHHYPVTLPDEPASKEAIEVHKAGEVMSLCSSKMSVANCCCALYCPGPRAAHTYATVGIFNYWVGLLLMTCFPCCTMWAVHGFTDFQEKLGLKKRNLCLGALCACFCTDCIIAQDAMILDYKTGARTEVYGVTLPDSDTSKEEKEQEQCFSMMVKGAADILCCASYSSKSKDDA
jgi:hypothetical protein